MVNTFLPHADFRRSAQALDDKRLGKQRVEGLQILKANLGLTKGWRNHPAAVMWRGHEWQLCQYIIAICDEWDSRGFKDTIREQVWELTQHYPVYIESTRKNKPWWLGNRYFHRSHRSNLKRKDPIHYDFPGPDDLPYLWPKEEGILKTTEKKVTNGNTGSSKESGVLQHTV
jgi:hypothetical protein